MNWSDIKTDEYSGFRWNSKHSTDYHMFIITNNNSYGVGFYNGPSFSNEYSRPQFEKANSQFLGVSFQTQKIKFKVGIYDFTIKEYRQLLNWLNPYFVGSLVFDFNDKWGYLVKLGNIQQSERYIIGRREEDKKFVDTFYTEMDLEFDIQGENCATAANPWSYTVGSESASKVNVAINTTITDYIDSDLDTSFALNFCISGLTKTPSTTITATAEYDRYPDDPSNINESVDLFTIELDNLTESKYNIRYDSESGILYLENGDGTKKILSLVTSVGNGKRILKSCNINKFKIPGKLTYPDFNIEGFKIIIEATNGTISNKDNQVTFECSARTNIV